jgi:hypothetical protein
MNRAGCVKMADTSPPTTSTSARPPNPADRDRIALEVALLMRFHPARSNGMAVPIWVRLPITLEIREDKEDPFPLIPPDPRPGQRRG